MKSRRGAQFDEINITPLTDIFLVLLIIMMVVTPMIDFKGLSMAVLTVGKDPNTKDKPKTILLAVTPKNEYLVAGEPVTKDALARTIQAKSAENPGGVVIETDPEATHEAMTFALSAVNLAGVTKVGIVQKEEKEDKSASDNSKHKADSKSKAKPKK